MSGLRLDVYVAESFALSRTKAKEIIESGGCALNGAPCLKASVLVNERDIVELLFRPEYVSRGAYKLEKALELFSIKVEGKICADIGSSTGGFTDLLLKRGAKLVYAIDSGSGQLDEALRKNERIVLMEGTNFRQVDKLPHAVNFLTADVSFISLTKLMPNIRAVLDDDAEAVLLIKPQFEAGRGNVGKNGIVRDRKAHVNVINSLIESAQAHEMPVRGLSFSPIKGQDGNIEYLLYLAAHGKTNALDIKKLVEEAFSSFKDKAV